MGLLLLLVFLALVFGGLGFLVKVFWVVALVFLLAAFVRWASGSRAP